MLHPLVATNSPNVFLIVFRCWWHVGLLWFRRRGTSFLSCAELLSMEKMTPLVQRRERPCTPRTIRCWASLWVSTTDFTNQWNQAVSLWLGFTSFLLQNHVNPAMDFTQTPPGMLALDNMLYLAKVHQDTYIRVRFDLRCHLAPLREAEESVTPLIFSLTTDCPGEQQPRGQARMSLWPMCHWTHQNALRDTPGWGTA